jgi:GNAT superfamily N-acetyltransferase
MVPYGSGHNSFRFRHRVVAQVLRANLGPAQLRFSYMRIRRGLPGEVAALTQIAHEAKRHWGYPENWIEHWHDDLTISAEFVATNQVFVAEEDDQILGFYALILRQEKAELDHLWVAPEHIGSGVGKQLFLHALQNASRRSVSEIEILSDPNAEGFYRKMGAHRIGETVSEIEGELRTLPLLSVKPTTP